MLWPLVFFLLQAPPSGTGTGTLEIHLTSAGGPTAARVYITDSSGKSQRVPGAVTYSRRNEVNSYLDGTASLPLPAGRYHILAEKGMEYRAATEDVTIREGGAKAVTLDIPHVFVMNMRGWYSGDLHNHRSPEEMPLIARAEDLNVSPVITRHVGGPNHRADTPFPGKHLVEIDATHVMSLHNQEVERLGEGHGAVDLLNAPTPVEVPKFDLFPMDLEYCRQARRDGAFLDAEKPIWKDVPIDAAFGLVDAIGVVNNHFHPDEVMTNEVTANAPKPIWIMSALPQAKPEYKTPAGFAQWMLDLYYSFLNCGFRIPVSAGSASGVMNSWPGYERVYVHLDGAFSYDTWFHELRAGHSFATNGPILLVTADGKLPGTELAWKRPVEVKLAVEANTQGLIDRIEIVSNGVVLRSIPVGKNEYRGTVRVKMEHPGWLAVRCFEPVDVTVRYAHTSPFWFPATRKLPVQKADAQHWADYVRTLAASVKPAQYPSQSDYESAQKIFNEAAAIYDGLAR